MSVPTTSRWTDAHVLAATLACASLAIGMLATLEHGATRLTVAGLGVLAVGVGLVADISVAVALTAVFTAAYLEVKRRFGLWDASQLPLAVAISATGLIVSGLAAQLGARLRHRAETTASPGLGSAPFLAPGSTLLALAPAQLRLDQERERAARFGSAVSVFAVDVSVTDGSLDERGQASARRVVARLLDSVISDDDVAFAWDERTMGAVLIDTDLESAWERLGDLLERASSASFAERSAGNRRSLADCARLTGVAVQPPAATEVGRGQAPEQASGAAILADLYAQVRH